MTEVDGILADLGVSSHHFDAVERGFSFRGEAPLDMRMNQRAAHGGRRGERLHRGGPDPHSGRLGRGRNTVEGCQLSGQGPCGGARDDHGAAGRSREALHAQKDEAKFLTKLFQALRIEVNGEMEALKMALEQSLRVLKPGGRLVVISYHSLEDRLVKNFMRSGNFGAGRKGLFRSFAGPVRPRDAQGRDPSAEELDRNPRSRSAKLRAAVKR